MYMHTLEESKGSMTSDMRKLSVDVFVRYCGLRGNTEDCLVVTPNRGIILKMRRHLYVLMDHMANGYPFG